MNRFDEFTLDHPVLGAAAVLGAALVVIFGVVLLLSWSGLIHNLNCPEGSRQMSYMVGKVSRSVCAKEVPEL